MTNVVYNKNGIPFDIDAIATDLNGKMDRDGINATASVCVESYQNGTSWYRLYSDGWCEQGGCYSGSIGTNAGVKILLLKEYKDLNFSAFAQVKINTTVGVSNSASAAVNVYSTSSIYIVNDDYAISSMVGAFWQACGYIR